jgi:hypothetical protein
LERGVTVAAYPWLVNAASALQHTSWAVALAYSDWAYPLVQFVHFTGLSLWICTNLALDLRLVGVGSKRQTAAQLARALLPWNWIGFIIAVTGGFMLFSITAAGYVTNPAFEVKLGILVPAAVLAHIAVQRKALRWTSDAETPAIARAAGFAEMALWLSVITAAVLIPYF